MLIAVCCMYMLIGSMLVIASRASVGVDLIVPVMILRARFCILCIWVRVVILFRAFSQDMDP